MHIQRAWCNYRPKLRLLESKRSQPGWICFCAMREAWSILTSSLILNLIPDLRATSDKSMQGFSCDRSLPLLGGMTRSWIQHLEGEQRPKLILACIKLTGWYECSQDGMQWNCMGVELDELQVTLLGELETGVEHLHLKPYFRTTITAWCIPQNPFRYKTLQSGNVSAQGLPYRSAWVTHTAIAKNVLRIYCRPPRDEILWYLLNTIFLRRIFCPVYYCGSSGMLWSLVPVVTHAVTLECSP
jgi:hypothetical protein